MNKPEFPPRYAIHQTLNYSPDAYCLANYQLISPYVEYLSLTEHEALLKETNEKLEKAREALRKIQNAYGSPYDEDFVTTEAREALREIDGTKEISDEGAG